MSNVIRFLESIGNNSELRLAGTEELERALCSAQIEPQVRDAILARDKARLEHLLSASSIVCCAVLGPEPGREDEEEEPSQDDDEIRAQTTARCAA
jgi:hypothetical protein